MVRYLSKKFELPENKMAVTSYGSSRPLNKVTDLAKNSRLEVLIYYKDADF